MQNRPPPTTLSAAAIVMDRRRLQELIDLLDRYDLNENSCTDNSDLSTQLRALKLS